MRGLLIVAALLLSPTLAWAQGLTVFAAASLTDALQDVGAAWTADGHQPIRFSFAASSTLARQIEQGAPADLFASADEKWMDYLDQHHLLVPGTRRDLLGNSLVLIVPANHPAHVDIKPGFDLARLIGPDGRLTTGDPAHVPVGIYAEQALKKLGVWDYAQHHLAPAADVRGALLLVERGEAAAGIVYATDAAVSKSVMVAGTFPADSHSPIVYPFAVVKSGDTTGAEALMQFLAGPAARTIFERRGFKTE